MVLFLFVDWVLKVNHNFLWNYNLFYFLLSIINKKLLLKKIDFQFMTDLFVLSVRDPEDTFLHNNALFLCPCVFTRCIWVKIYETMNKIEQNFLYMFFVILNMYQLKREIFPQKRALWCQFLFIRLFLIHRKVYEVMRQT